MISIPEYFKAYISSEINLNETPKICCPFHKEALPSFSYSPEKGVWRCFGACKAGGDVIDLHRVNYRFKTRAEAKKSLYRLLGIAEDKTTLVFGKPERPTIPAGMLEKSIAYACAVRAATTVSAWLELDYIMSQSPVDVSVLEMFANEKRGASLDDATSMGRD
jgi:hypothetical protein